MTKDVNLDRLTEVDLVRFFHYKCIIFPYFYYFHTSSLEGSHDKQPTLKRVLYSISLKAENLQKIFAILLHRRFAYSPSFNYSAFMYISMDSCIVVKSTTVILIVLWNCSSFGHWVLFLMSLWHTPPQLWWFCFLFFVCFVLMHFHPF